MSDKPEDAESSDWLWATDLAARAIDAKPPSGPQLRSHRIASVAEAILQARSQAFEECAKIVEDCNMWDGRREIAQAIRQNVGEK